MNINTRSRIIIYLVVIYLLANLLFKEYTYVCPYKDSGIVYPFSSSIFIWWFLIICSIILSIPLVRKQKIGFLGLMLFLAVLIKPIIQPKLRKETATEFYTARKVVLKQLVKKYPNQPDRKMITPAIEKLDFEELIIVDGNYFFLVWDENYPYPYGIYYSEKRELPSKILDSSIRCKKLEKNWYEFEYVFE